MGISDAPIHIAFDRTDRLSVNGSDNGDPFGVVQENQITGFRRIAAGFIGVAQSLLQRSGAGSGGETAHLRIAGAEAHKQSVPISVGRAIPVAVAGIAFLLTVAIDHKILFAFLIAKLRLGDGDQTGGKIAAQPDAAEGGSPVGLRLRSGHGQFGLRERSIAVRIADGHLYGVAAGVLRHDGNLFRFRNLQRIAFGLTAVAKHNDLSLIGRSAAGNAQLETHGFRSGHRIAHVRPELDRKLLQLLNIFRCRRFFRWHRFFRDRGFFGRFRLVLRLFRGLRLFGHFRLCGRSFADFRGLRFLRLLFGSGGGLFLYGFRFGFGGRCGGFFHRRFLLGRLSFHLNDGHFLRRRHFLCQTYICQQHNARQQD